jgi:hypothetical protein
MEFPLKQFLVFFVYISLIVACGFMAERKGRHVFTGLLAGLFLPFISFILFSVLPTKKVPQKEKAEKIDMREARSKLLEDPCPYCKWSIKEGKDCCDECGKEFYEPEVSKMIKKRNQSQFQCVLSVIILSIGTMRM